jgi:hypothetical protein
MDLHSPRRHSESPRLPPAAIAGQAMFSGCLSVINVSRTALRSELPRSVALPDSESAEHPCLLVFGEQGEGTTFFGGLSVPWGIRYHELMVAVPFVSWEGGGGEHLFVSGMTCDFQPAVWNGNFYYGFSKRFARMGWDGESFSVADESDCSGFRAALCTRGPAYSDGLDWIRSAAALPVLGCRQGGVFVRSRFDWDLRRADVEGVTLRLAVEPQFPELPLGAQAACHDAYRVRRMRWCLSWPSMATPP